MSNASQIELLRNILLGRCPNCGTGSLFSGFLSTVPVCGHCGTQFPSDAAADGPAFFIMLISGFVVVGGILITELSYTPPWWVHLLVWLPVAVILCIAPLRPLKALFVTLQWQHDAHEGRVTDGSPEGGSQ